MSEEVVCRGGKRCGNGKRGECQDGWKEMSAEEREEWSLWKWVGGNDSVKVNGKT